jgi:hypothetical protein
MSRGPSLERAILDLLRLNEYLSAPLLAAPRSEVKTNGDLGCWSHWLWRRRSARSSSRKIDACQECPLRPTESRDLRRPNVCGWPSQLSGVVHRLTPLHSPYGKPHLVLTRGTAIDANVCIASLWQAFYARDFHLVSAPACRPFGTTGF